MAKKIKLELTIPQFNALMALAEEMAITSGMTDEIVARETNRRVNLVNKALRQNDIDFTIDS